MKNSKVLTKCVLCLCTLVIGLGAFSQSAMARSTTAPTKKYVAPVPSDIDTRWAASHSPWDFSGMLGLYNPGFGFQATAAYRVADSLLENIDDSLSIEAGLGFFGASQSIAGSSLSYSQVYIPILARWDFRIADTKFIAGPMAGFTYFTAGTAVLNGVQENFGGGGLYFQLGGYGMYQFTDKWAARVQLTFIGYTTITFGATYFL